MVVVATKALRLEDFTKESNESQTCKTISGQDNIMQLINSVFLPLWYRSIYHAMDNLQDR